MLLLIAQILENVLNIHVHARVICGPGEQKQTCQWHLSTVALLHFMHVISTNLHLREVLGRSHRGVHHVLIWLLWAELWWEWISERKQPADVRTVKALLLLVSVTSLRHSLYDP